MTGRVTIALGLFLWKEQLNTELLKAVKELQELINQMTMEEWEEYSRGTKRR